MHISMEHQADISIFDSSYRKLNNDLYLNRTSAEVEGTISIVLQEHPRDRTDEPQ